nr:hypothetical protein [uncultured Desulfobacter sp.]
MIRFGLCCIFKAHPVKFRKTTAKYLEKFSRDEQMQRLANLCTVNAKSLLNALEFCRDNQIGSFRINSQILPLKTHPRIFCRCANNLKFPWYMMFTTTDALVTNCQSNVPQSKA